MEPCRAKGRHYFSQRSRDEGTMVQSKKTSRSCNVLAQGPQELESGFRGGLKSWNRAWGLEELRGLKPRTPRSQELGKDPKPPNPPPFSEPLCCRARCTCWTGKFGRALSKSCRVRCYSKLLLLTAVCVSLVILPRTVQQHEGFGHRDV